MPICIDCGSDTDAEDTMHLPDVGRVCVVCAESLLRAAAKPDVSELTRSAFSDPYEEAG
jgi:hypothetical protein